MKVGSTLFEARMVAAPTDIRFVLPLGTTDLHSCPPSPPPPKPAEGFQRADTENHSLKGSITYKAEYHFLCGILIMTKE